ncbi:unnamed protein product [Amoebophrya sp. A25]|nr:unnamed protein product [Amoebophrya sp. A25]|eukprot:GSA25T00013183001.1
MSQFLESSQILVLSNLIYPKMLSFPSKNVVFSWRRKFALFSSVIFAGQMSFFISCVQAADDIQHIDSGNDPGLYSKEFPDLTLLPQNEAAKRELEDAFTSVPPRELQYVPPTTLPATEEPSIYNTFTTTTTRGERISEPYLEPLDFFGVLRTSTAPPTTTTTTPAPTVGIYVPTVENLPLKPVAEGRIYNTTEPARDGLMGNSSIMTMPPLALASSIDLSSLFSLNGTVTTTTTPLPFSTRLIVDAILELPFGVQFAQAVPAWERSDAFINSWSTAGCISLKNNIFVRDLDCEYFKLKKIAESVGLERVLLTERGSGPGTAATIATTGVAISSETTLTGARPAIEHVEETHLHPSPKIATQAKERPMHEHQAPVLETRSAVSKTGKKSTHLRLPQRNAHTDAQSLVGTLDDDEDGHKPQAQPHLPRQEVTGHYAAGSGSSKVVKGGNFMQPHRNANVSNRNTKKEIQDKKSRKQNKRGMQVVVGESGAIGGVHHDSASSEHSSEEFSSMQSAGTTSSSSQKKPQADSKVHLARAGAKSEKATRKQVDHKQKDTINAINLTKADHRHRHLTTSSSDDEDEEEEEEVSSGLRRVQVYLDFEVGCASVEQKDRAEEAALTLDRRMLAQNMNLYVMSAQAAGELEDEIRFIMPVVKKVTELSAGTEKQSTIPLILMEQAGEESESTRRAPLPTQWRMRLFATMLAVAGFAFL